MGETSQNGGSMKKLMKDTIMHTKLQSSKNGFPESKKYNGIPKFYTSCSTTIGGKKSVDAANEMKRLLGIKPPTKAGGGVLTDYFA